MVSRTAVPLQTRAFLRRCSSADTCAICRNSLYEPSLDVQACAGDVDASHPGLMFARGSCSHVFHLDCVQRCALPCCVRVRPFPVRRFIRFRTQIHLVRLMTWRLVVRSQMAEDTECVPTLQ